MRWTERQQAMLREMGVRLWERSPDAAAPVATSVDAAVVVAEEPRRPIVVPAEPSTRVALPAASARTEVEWLPADWLIVGEPFDAAGAAPATAAGDQERLLANMLQAIGLSRQAPARAARACHLALLDGTPGRLDDALERVAPRLILALGRAAAEALLDVDEPLGRLRGKLHERAGIRVVVSFPLAYLLRNPTEKAKAWADLCLAVRALEAIAG